MECKACDRRERERQYLLAEIVRLKAQNRQLDAKNEALDDGYINLIALAVDEEPRQKNGH